MKKKIDLILISGVSGAGKTYTLSCFEENGYLIMENIPISLIDNLYEEFENNINKYKKVALSISLNDAKNAYIKAREFKDISVTFIGLDCSKEVLLERYKLSRRIHPLQTNDGLTLDESINIEKNNILQIKDYFTHYIDTSKFSLGDLRNFYVHNIFDIDEKKMVVNFISFGHKKSVPQDVEMVFDVRILPNPYWVNELKTLTGLDKNIVDYIFSFPITNEFLSKIISYLDFYLDKVEKSGRRMITIGIACSGGQHRSVVVAEYLKKYYQKTYNTYLMHRDLKK